MNTIYTNDKTIRDLAAKFAPDKKFAGKQRVKIESVLSLQCTGMNWGGGYLNLYKVVNLSTLDCVELDPPNFMEGSSLKPMKMTPNVAVICYHYAGLGKFISVYLHPDNFTPLISKKVELSREEQIVLYCTMAFKNSYGGRTDIRRKEARHYGLNASPEQWKSLLDGLIGRGLLKKGGGLTTEGLNVATKDMDYVEKRETPLTPQQDCPVFKGITH